MHSKWRTARRRRRWRPRGSPSRPRPPPRNACRSSSAPAIQHEMLVTDSTSVAPDRLEPEEVVEARHRLEVGGRDAHHRRRLADALRRAPPVVALHRPQRGDRRGPRVRVAAHRPSRSRSPGRSTRGLGRPRSQGSRDPRPALIRLSSSSPEMGTPHVLRFRRACRGWAGSSVHPAEDRVEHRQVLDQVGDVAADGHLAQLCRLTNEGRGSAPAPAWRSRRRPRSSRARRAAASIG